jgi:hypothetical protein
MPGGLVRSAAATPRLVGLVARSSLREGQVETVDAAAAPRVAAGTQYCHCRAITRAYRSTRGVRLGLGQSPAPQLAGARGAYSSLIGPRGHLNPDVKSKPISQFIDQI